jgi:lipopolysaccharide export system protein LptA
MKLLPALLAGVLALPVLADDVVPQPTTLYCDHAEMWSVGAETRGLCTGNVILVGTNLKIVCDRLEFVALGVGDKTDALPKLDKFQSLLATGHVTIVQGEREATCGRAEVLPRSDKVVLTETPVVVDHGTGWTSAGDIITMFHGERRVIVEKSHVTGPAIKDLGFDKSQPVTPADGTARPTPPK